MHLVLHYFDVVIPTPTVAEIIAHEYVKGCNRSEDQSVSTKLIYIYMHGNMIIWQQKIFGILTL